MPSNPVALAPTLADTFTPPACEARGCRIRLFEPTDFLQSGLVVHHNGVTRAFDHWATNDAADAPAERARRWLADEHATADEWGEQARQLARLSALELIGG